MQIHRVKNPFTAYIKLPFGSSKALAIQKVIVFGNLFF